MTERGIILDACSLINFYASEFFDSILSSFKNQCCIVDQVNDESLFIRNPTDLPSKYYYKPIELQDSIQLGKLKLIKLETENEKKVFIKLAQRLDDGEAATIALAIEREMKVVTDDKKAIQIFCEEVPNIEILTTLDVIKFWYESSSINDEDVKLALSNIRVYANYLPTRNHQLFQWWSSRLM